MKNFWLSWYHAGAFELHTPWWISGYRSAQEDQEEDQATICAAVVAESEEAAKQLIIACHDTPPTEIEFRFVEERPSGWSPFCDRFRAASWMRWPPEKP